MTGRTVRMTNAELEALRNDLLPGQWLFCLRSVATRGGVKEARLGEIRVFKTLCKLGYLEKQGGLWLTSAKAAIEMARSDQYLALSAAAREAR